jgi:hypothetical protein
MIKSMITLVSAQRMQNIIPILQRDANYRQLWLIRSEDADVPNSRFSMALQQTIEALEGFLDTRSAEPSVGAYGIADTQAIVATLLRESGGEAVVNFTGGTKCMSIGAYLAARQAQTNALYVDTANEELVWFCPDGRIQKEKFDLVGRLTVRTYLKANGKNVDEERTQRYVLDQTAIDVARRLWDLWPSCIEGLEALGLAVSNRNAPPPSLEPDLASVLEAGGLAKKNNIGDWKATRKGRRFLTGRWLDALVHTLLLDSGEFDDVQLNLRLKGVENELDVMTTRRGQLALVECKSGSLGGQTTLNKLQAIRSGFGTFARAFFVSSRYDDQIDGLFRDRAREYGVREVITRESLPQIVSIIKHRMRGTP